MVLLQEVYPGHCSGLSGRSLVVVSSSSVRPKGVIFLHISAIYSIFFGLPLPVPFLMYWVGG